MSTCPTSGAPWIARTRMSPSPSPVASSLKNSADSSATRPTATAVYDAPSSKDRSADSTAGVSGLRWTTRSRSGISI